VQYVITKIGLTFSLGRQKEKCHFVGLGKVFTRRKRDAQFPSSLGAWLSRSVDPELGSRKILRFSTNPVAPKLYKRQPNVVIHIFTGSPAEPREYKHQPMCEKNKL